MKTILFSLFAGLIAVGAQAQEPANADGVAVGNLLENGNMILGRVLLAEADKTDQATDVDVFALRNCATNKNMRIRKLRLRAPAKRGDGTPNLDALIRSVTVIYGNGFGDTFDMPGAGLHLKVTHNQAGIHDIDLPGNQRCVRAVSINGEQFEAGNNHKPSQVLVVGVR